MTFIEQIFLALVLIAFFVFGITLAVVAWQTNRYQRDRDRQHTGKTPGDRRLSKAA